MLILLTNIVAAAGVIISTKTDTSLKIDILRYEPAPAEPGSILDLWVKVTAQGDLDSPILPDVKLEVVDEFPFSAVSDSERVKGFGDMAPTESRTVRYRIKVHGDATPGTNEVRFKYFSKTESAGITSAPLEVEIKSISATITIASVASEPEEIPPGDIAELTVVLRNDALSRLRDLTAKLDLTSTAIPFAPLRSTTEKKLRSLASGESAEIKYEIIALADAESKVYRVPFTLTYYDDAGNLFSKNDTIGLLVSAKPDLEVTLEDTDAFRAGKTGSIVVSVSNTGPSDVKFMTLKLLESDDYTIIGKAQEYLGNLESDDFETAEFKINVGKVKDSAEIKVLLDYRDAYNNVKEDNILLSLPIYSGAELRKFGLNGDVKNVFTPIIYLLVILFLYYGVKEWRKSRAFDVALKTGIEDTLLAVFRVVLFFRWRNLKRVPKRIKLFFMKL